MQKKEKGGGREGKEREETTSLEREEIRFVVFTGQVIFVLEEACLPRRKALVYREFERSLLTRLSEESGMARHPGQVH